ncbi:hypothetical protein, partial [Gluconacetobacter takamatsuzukensis]|nr:hypothetical protein [Gluconacetobacter takamatsuzukensis]
LIDSSSNSTGAAPLSGSGGSAVYGADLLATPMALAGVDATVTGATTSLSATSVTLDTSVAQLNDAPTMAGVPTMPSEPEDTTASRAPGSTVASLLTPVFTDQTDQQQSASNSTGSTANSLAGMAITGDAANPATQGTWRYSTDGGASWTVLPSDLSSTNALVLGSNVQLD